MAKLDPADSRAPGVARLRSADWPRRLGPGARACRGDSRPPRRRRTAPSARVPSNPGRSDDDRRPGHPRLRRVRQPACSAGASRRRATPGPTTKPIPTELEVALPDYGETLRPDFAVRERRADRQARPRGSSSSQTLEREDFDLVTRADGHLEASAHSRMERLLRETGVPAGLLFNGRALRLISAPRGESSGWLEFHVADMIQTAGRPISHRAAPAAR